MVVANDRLQRPRHSPGQMMLFYMLAAELGRGTSPPGPYEAIPDFAARALEQKPAILELVQRYVFMENCVVVGRGLAYANAYELALKLMETCYVVAERFSSADFLHGPVAMVERHFPVILFAPPGVMLPGVKDLIGRLRELHADTLVITSDLEAAADCSRAIIMPREIDEFLRADSLYNSRPTVCRAAGGSEGSGSGRAAVVVESDENV